MAKVAELQHATILPIKLDTAGQILSLYKLANPAVTLDHI